jgi:hypothetical protein
MTLTGQQRQAREQQPYGIPLGGDVHRVPPGIDVGSGFGKLAQSQGYRQLLGPLLRRLNQRQQLLLPDRIGTRRDVEVTYSSSSCRSLAASALAWMISLSLPDVRFL